MATADSSIAGRTAVSGGARERILEAAYDLFSRRGVRAVGIDAIIDRAGVARMTLYRHFASKEELALACLERREQRWTREWLQAQIELRGTTPPERLLAVFDVFDEWFQTPDFEGCTFIRILLESDDGSDLIGEAGRTYLAGIRSVLADLAREARIPDPEDFAGKWHILMKGSIVAAGEGDLRAARRAQEVARLLLAHELQGVSPA